MPLINTSYPAVLPAMGDAAENLAGITAKTGTQLETQLSRMSGQSLSDIDWSSFGKAISHQVITTQQDINEESGAGLDSLVDTILSHIGRDA